MCARACACVRARACVCVHACACVCVCVCSSLEGGLIPLHNASSFGHADVVTMLVGAKADPNARDSWNFTPLHEAAIKGKLEVCIGECWVCVVVPNVLSVRLCLASIRNIM